MENMGADKHLIKAKFDDIDEKIDFLIDLCQELEAENTALKGKNEQLEKELAEKSDSQKLLAEQDTLIQSSMTRLMKKLDAFSKSRTGI